MFSYLKNDNTSYYLNILMLEILTRVDGGEPKWVDIKTLRTMTRRSKKISSPSSLKDFDVWWELYSYKKQRKKAITAWNNNVKEKLIPKIMEHTRKYILATPNIKYRQYPTTYLNGHTWEDEIVEEEKTYELKEYPRDKTDFPRAWCSKCEKIDTYYEWEIKKGSKCCNMATLLPFDPKITKRKYD